MISVAGGGPGNPKLLTLEVKELIEKSEKVIAFGRIRESLQSLRKDIIGVKRMDELLAHLKDAKGDILVLASGDPNFFGVVELLKKKGIEISKVYPGISSIQYFFSKIQKSFSNIETISVHGRDLDFSKLKKDTPYAFLIDEKNNGNFISKSYYELGIEGEIYFGYNLSYENELIFKKKIGEKIEEPSSLGVVLVVPNVD